MKNHDNIPAFTIMELVIAMLISAIVIGLTYSAYSIVSQSYISFTGRNEDISTIAWLEQRLSRDMDRAEVVTRKDSTISIESSYGSIRYRFLKERVIRQNISADTFKVNSLDLMTSFVHGVADEASTVDTARTIDDLRFDIFFKGQRIPYHYHKTYSSVNLFQSAENAIH